MERRFTDSQWRALELGRSLAVRAGAGSGKTTLLVARYLALFEAAHARGEALAPGSVLALTFTEKAAAEMTSRVREAISGREGEPWERLRRGLGGAEISTLHAFAARALRRHPEAAGVEADFAIIDPGRRRRQLAELIDQRLLELEWQQPRLIEPLAGVFSRRRLAGALHDLFDALPISERWLREISGQGEAAYVASRAARREAITAELGARLQADVAWQLLRRQLVRVRPEAGALGKRIDELAQRLDDPDYLNCRDPLSLRGRIGELRRLMHRGKRPWTADPETSARLGPAVGDLSMLLLRHTPGVDSGGCEAIADAAAFQLARLFDDLLARHRERQRRQGELDFPDLVTRLVSTLERDPRAAEALRERYRYIMVDEFQDTDREQWRMIELLRRPQPGALFLVGDEKQSIYRFRGADVAVFSQATRALASEPAGGVVELGENFRSSPAVMETIDATFSRVFAPDVPGGALESFEAAAQPLRPMREPAPGGVSLLVTALDAALDPADLSAARALVEPEAQEARAVAGALLEAHGRGRPWDEMAVLLRSRAMLPALERALTAAGVPHLVWRGSGFFETQEVGDLMELLRCLLQPDDAVALLAVLRSPLVGLSDVALQRIAKLDERGLEAGLRRLADGDPALAALDARDRRAAARAAALLDRLRPLAPASPLGELVREALERSGALVAYAARPDGEQALANIEKLRGMLREADGLSLSNAAALEALALRAEGSEGQAALELRAGGGVRVMTVHASKGLEFPLVVVPGLARAVRKAASSPQLLLELPGHGPTLGLTIPQEALVERGLDRWTRPLARLLVSREVERLDRAEAKRLFYVACTRACDELILSAALALQDDGRYGSPQAGGRQSEWWGMLAQAWGAEDGLAPRSERLRAGDQSLAVRWAELPPQEPPPPPPPSPLGPLLEALAGEPQPELPGPPAGLPTADDLRACGLDRAALSDAAACPLRAGFRAVLGGPDRRAELLSRWRRELVLAALLPGRPPDRQALEARGLALAEELGAPTAWGEESELVELGLALRAEHGAWLASARELRARWPLAGELAGWPLRFELDLLWRSADGGWGWADLDPAAELAGPAELAPALLLGPLLGEGGERLAWSDGGWRRRSLEPAGVEGARELLQRLAAAPLAAPARPPCDGCAWAICRACSVPN